MNGAIRITEPDQIRVALADLRTILRTTQKQLGADAGYLPHQVSSWLSGRNAPTVATTIRLANALGYDLALVPREDA